MEYHLGVPSNLVVNPDFETGIMQIGKGTPLTASQQLAVMSLVKLDNPVTLMEAESDDEEESYAMKVARQLKQEELATRKHDQFMNLDVIPGTSVNCERLFSLAKNILTGTHKCSSAVLFEALLFLKTQICGMHTQLEKRWGEHVSSRRGRGMREVHMIIVSTTEVAAMMNMEVTFTRNSY
jgi:hypothetical protein